MGPDRIQRARESMARRGVDRLLLSAGADLRYLIGYEAMPLERPTLLVLPSEGDPTVLVPELEAPRVKEGPFELRPWSETEDAIALAADLIGSRGMVAVNDQMWAAFLLRFQALLPRTQFRSATPVMRSLRERKDTDELAALRAAGAAADRVVERLRAERFSGRSERELSRVVADHTVSEGHESASFWIVASGPNGASPHHEPGDRVVNAGDMVVVDFGGKIGGYASDCTRTFVVGPPNSEQVEVHGVVHDAQRKASEAVKPGMAASQIDAIARAVIEGAGYGEYFIHRTGHGIGLEGHEHPYLVEGNDDLVEAGMCFSIEPGIYLPGRFGVRIEDIVTVTDQGHESFNLADRSLIEVG